MYEEYLRALLAPLGVYQLDRDSLSGAELYALGQGLDAVRRTRGCAAGRRCSSAAPPPSRRRSAGRPSRRCCKSTGTA